MLLAHVKTLLRKFAANVSLAWRDGLADALFFDEAVYRAEHEDVARAVAAGGFRSCFEHYVLCGRWEGRRFPLRAGWLGEAMAEKLWSGVGGLQAHAEAFVAALRSWDISYHLRSRDGRRLMALPGSHRGVAAKGEWYAPLPDWAKRPGWYLLEVKAATHRDSHVVFAFQGVGADGRARGEPAALQCRPDAASSRLLRLPRGVTRLRAETVCDPYRSYPRSLRLEPYPESRVQRRILGRILRHHPLYRSLPEDEVVQQLGRVAALEGRPQLEVFWDAYDCTFPSSGARSTYRDWIIRVEQPETQQIDLQANTRIELLTSRPVISVLLVARQTDQLMLGPLLDSLLRQSYPHWEVCVAGDASTSPHVRPLLQEYSARDSRIQVDARNANGSGYEAANAALAMTRGDFVAVLDGCDLVARHALLHVAEAINAQPRAEVLYGDTDEVGADGRRRNPHFRPRYNPDLLLGQDYVGDFVARRSRVRHLGGFRAGYEARESYDLLLRLTSGLEAEQIVHIPRVLFHRRLHVQGTDKAGDAEARASAAGLAAVRDCIARQCKTATVWPTETVGCYRIKWPLPDPLPLVSLLIPTRDGGQRLEVCLGSILSKTEYAEYEVVILDNGSVEPETLRYFDRIGQDPRVRVLSYDHPFNYSAINNYGVRHAKGSILGLINDDIEVIHGDWLREMVSHAFRPEIGCVGAKLLYPDGTIQHGGVIIGLGGIAGHAYKYQPGDSPGYFRRLQVAHAVSAVTAACLVVKRSIYQEVRGMDETHLPIAFNDVDFCLKVREAGYRNLLTPHAVLVHHESATRGSDEEPEKRERFQLERTTMRDRWRHMLFDDPYHSPHLSLDRHDYVIRVPDLVA